MAEWVTASKCPKCGGRMMMSEHFASTHDYLIRKDGRLYKRFRRSAEGPVDCVTAVCLDCETYWDGDNTARENNRLFVRGSGSG